MAACIVCGEHEANGMSPVLQDALLRSGQGSMQLSGFDVPDEIARESFCRVLKSPLLVFPGQEGERPC